MLALSRSINPECEHIHGDMRMLRLEGREFDAVFVHDAIDYLTSETELRAAFETAWHHLLHGGAALFEPDHVRETSSRPRITVVTTLRHLATNARSGTWNGRGSDPDDTWYFDEFAYLLRDGNRIDPNARGPPPNPGSSPRPPGSSCSPTSGSWTCGRFHRLRRLEEGEAGALGSCLETGRSFRWAGS